MVKAAQGVLQTIGSGKPGRRRASVLETRADRNRSPLPLPRQFKLKRSSHTLKRANMQALSSVLLTPRRGCEVSVLHSKTPRLPATDPSWSQLTTKWKPHKKIWTLSTYGGRNFKRKPTVYPLADGDGIALNWKPVICGQMVGQASPEHLAVRQYCLTLYLDGGGSMVAPCSLVPRRSA